MGEIEFLFALLVAVALLVSLARRLGLPYPIFLVLGGLGLGALPGLPEIDLEPEVVLLVFVPPLVHAAGYQASPRRLVRDVRPIALAAVVLVAATIVAVAVAAHALVDELSWPAAFVLATVLAPTDLVAATAVFRRLGAPERVVNLVEGENLVNDATALTAWRVAVAAAGAGTFSLGDAAVELVVVAAGGTLVGLAGGWAVAWLRRRLDDSLVEITVTLLTPYVLYIGAEQLEMSGILAAVVSGVYLGRRDPELSDPGTRLQAYAFWEVFVFLLESLLFVLVGLQFPALVEDLGGGSVGTLLASGAVLALVVMAVRMLHQFTTVELDERIGGRQPIPWRERAVVGWAGMRGAVSLAIALSVPLDVAGRDEMIFLTIVVIVVTLTAQGLTLPALIRAMRFPAEQPDERRSAMVRFRTIEAALDHIGRLSLADDGFDPSTVERARSLYAQRANQLAGECSDGVPLPDSDTGAWLRLRVQLLQIERGRLAQMRDEGEITTPQMNAVQHDIDLELERLGRRMAAA
ncbi:MAG TPA: Na+/H+ antiporter [Solirubrobacteraceae bacterium]|jgi:CPA1 family monovalent cation:H+ antiporter|nr:Na+/H+ antiporter [Solirubrobacteraceae bacterium]